MTIYDIETRPDRSLVLRARKFTDQGYTEISGRAAYASLCQPPGRGITVLIVQDDALPCDACVVPREKWLSWGWMDRDCAILLHPRAAHNPKTIGRIVARTYGLDDAETEAWTQKMLEEL